MLWDIVAILDQIAGKVNIDSKVFGICPLDVLNEYPILMPWLWLCCTDSFPQHVRLMLILKNSCAWFVCIFANLAYYFEKLKLEHDGPIWQ